MPRLLVPLCVAAMACALVLSGCSPTSESSGSSSASSSSPSTESPQMEYAMDNDSLLAFSANTTAALLSTDGDKAQTENLCFSPTSLYLATSMAALGADGDAQAQLLELLGMDTEADLRTFCQQILALDTQMEDEGELAFANSLWIDGTYTFRNAYATMVEETFDASLFDVDFKAAGTQAQVDAWIDQATHGLVTHGIDTTPDTVALLMNTLYLKDGWLEPFSPERTAEGSFTTPSGNANVPFLNGTVEDALYLDQPTFTAAALETASGMEMTFFLPKGEVGSPAELLGEAAELLSILNTPLEHRSVRWSLPSFEATSELKDLIKPLEALGVTVPFDNERTGSFTSMIDSDEDFCINTIAQSNRVSLNEYGIEAASATIIEMVKTTSLMDPAEPVPFVLDRPFAYTIASREGHVLFVGIVNDPTL